MAVAGVSALKRTAMCVQLPTWIQAVLALGLWPVFIAWSGFIGVHRIPLFTEVLGALLAGVALHAAWKYRRAMNAWLNRRHMPHHYPIAAVALIFTAAYFIARWCYVGGGVNNWPADEMRGLAFTSAFAANYLKPAHPLDLSLPISYGYYFYEYTAFLYAAVGGYSWPSITLLAGALVAIAGFYFTFVRFTQLLTGRSDSVTWLVAVLAVTFFGQDFIAEPYWQNRYTMDWWNQGQITHMAALWHWVYHYLACATLCLAGLLSLHAALAQRRRDMLITGAILLCLAPTYAPITGVFFASVAMLALLLTATVEWRSGTPRWLLREGLCALLIVLPISAFILLPQVFTFMGRESYMHLDLAPRIWFGRHPMSTASWEEWRRFFNMLYLELGPMMLTGLLALPLFFIARRRAIFPVALAASLVVGIFISESFVSAGTNDWYWRTGFFALPLLLAIMTAWLFATLLPKHGWRHYGCWALLAAILSPGAYNFAAEHWLRTQHCKLPPDYLLQVNEVVELHTVIHTPPFAPKESFIAGRVAIAPGNSAWNWLSVYSISTFFASDRLEWSSDSPICAGSLYGKRLPNGQFVELQSTGTIWQAQIHHCSP